VQRERLTGRCSVLQCVAVYYRVRGSGNSCQKPKGAMFHYRWVMSRIWMSHVPHVNESCPTCEWVMSQIWMSHVPHVKESCQIYEWVMSHIWKTHVTHMKEAMRHVTHMHGTCTINSWLRDDELIGVSWLTQTWDMTHSHVRRDSFIWDTCLSFICVTQFDKIQRDSLKIHRFNPD